MLLVLVCFVVSQSGEQGWSGKLSRICGFTFGVYDSVRASSGLHRGSQSAENPNLFTATVDAGDAHIVFPEQSDSCDIFIQ